MFAAQIVVGEHQRVPYFILTGFGIFFSSMVVYVIVAVYCQNKMMDDVCFTDNKSTF